MAINQILSIWKIKKKTIFVFIYFALYQTRLYFVNIYMSLFKSGVMCLFCVCVHFGIVSLLLSECVPHECNLFLFLF